MKSKKGFTLVEMMLVVAIIIIISAVGIIAIGDTIKNSRKQQDEYQQHIDSMGLAQGNVKNIMANTRNPNVPDGSAKPAEPKGDTGDKTPVVPVGGEGDKEDDKEDEKIVDDTKKDGDGVGLIGGDTDKKDPVDEDSKTEDSKEPEEPTSGDAVSGSAGLTVTNNWGNSGQGKLSIPSSSGKEIAKVTLIIDGAKFSNVWNFDNNGAYSGTKSSDNTQYTITINSGKSGVTSLKDINIQWENGNPPKNIEYIVEYK